MRVLAFGTYQREYPRNAQVRSCLRRAGVEVTEAHVAVWDGRRDGWSAGPRDVGRLLRAQLRLLRARPESFDVLLVGYPGHLDVAAARRVAAGRPIVLDPLVSLHDTLVGDRGRFRAGSFAARAVALADRQAFRRADLVVADTAAHADFFAGRLGVPRDRLAVCLVGAEDAIFRARPRAPASFHALFVGKLIPLHGLDTILAAARLAPEVPFRIVGSGQLDALLHARPANVGWLPWVEYARLPGELHRAGCALGVFAPTAKAGRVIPNKAYQALACGVPLVTADTPAARELLEDGRDALLVPAGDPAALAAAVRRLAADPALRRRIGDAGRATYEAQASEQVLGARWRGLLESLVAGHR